MNRIVATFAGVRVVLADSITTIGIEEREQIVVSGSHGGITAARYAATMPLAGCFFNDAGVGKDQAGISALSLLQSAGTPAATYAHTSARIGDAEDAWQNGLITHLNAAAVRAGLTPGQTVREAVLQLSGLQTEKQ